jgi:polar amino acid transport system substrate-binding protein
MNTRLLLRYTLAFSFVLLMLIGFFILVPHIPQLEKNTSQTVNAKPSAYDRVLQSKTLRVAYISYPPSFIKDPKTGEYSGIFYEVLQEMAKRMELKVEFVEETAWGTMIESVNSGRADIVCTGLWPNATRGKFADFTDPVYFSPIKAYVKTGNSSFDGKLAAINSRDVAIAAIDGEMSSIIARADFPNATVHALPQTTDVAQMLLEISSGKAAVTFVESAVASEFLEKNANAVQEVNGIPPLRVFPNVMMVAKGESELQSMLNISMAELANTGVIDNIVAKYEKVPGIFLRRQLPYRTTP